MEVLINNQQKKRKVNTRRIRRLALAIMQFEGFPDNAELSVVFCDDDFIQKLNHDHLGKNRPTDVLSFPLGEGQAETGVRLLGDIVISVETACHQAEKMRHSTDLEIVFLLVHGLLHLHGLDHTGKMQLRVMREREEAVVEHLCSRKLLRGMNTAGSESLIRRAVPVAPGSSRRPRSS